MKKVEFVVELDNEKGEIQYAYLCRGVMTRRHIYARSCMSNPGDKEYIWVKRNETRNCSESVSSVYEHLYDQARAISVPDKLGLDDPRIMSITKDTKIPEAVMEVLEKFWLECMEVKNN